MKLKYFFIISLFLTVNSVKASEVFSVKSELNTDLLNCEGKMKLLSYEQEVNSFRTFFSYKIGNQYYLLIGGANEIYLNAANVFKAAVFTPYQTVILILDEKLNKVQSASFSSNAMTIPGSVKDMPTYVVGFGSYVAVLNYFESMRGAISIFKKLDLARVANLTFGRNLYSITADRMKEVNGTLEIELDIDDQNKEDRYFGLHLPMGFRYWVGLNSDFSPKILRRSSL